VNYLLRRLWQRVDVMVRAGVRKASTCRLVHCTTHNKNQSMKSRMCTHHRPYVYIPPSRLLRPSILLSHQHAKVQSPSLIHQMKSTLVLPKIILSAEIQHHEKDTHTLNQNIILSLSAVRLAFTSTKNKCADTSVGNDDPLGSDSMCPAYICSGWLLS